MKLFTTAFAVLLLVSTAMSCRRSAESESLSSTANDGPGGREQLEADDIETAEQVSQNVAGDRSSPAQRNSAAPIERPDDTLAEFGTAFFEAIRSNNLQNVRELAFPERQLDEWSSTMVFESDEERKRARAVLKGKIAKLPDELQAAYEKTLYIAKNAGIDWSRTSVVSISPFGEELDKHTRVEIFEGIRIIFEDSGIPDAQFVIMANGGTHSGGRWYFLEPWDGLTKLDE